MHGLSVPQVFVHGKYGSNDSETTLLASVNRVIAKKQGALSRQELIGVCSCMERVNVREQFSWNQSFFFVARMATRQCGDVTN